MDRRLLLYSTPEPERPKFIPRGPLPPFDPDSVDSQTGAPLPVYTTLREAPPSKSDVSWWRGDAWGMTIDNLPFVPGGAGGPAQSRVLTYFLDRYGRRYEAETLARHVGYGYTHISLSPQDSFAFRTSEDDYVRMAWRCRNAGLNVHHLMRSKYYTAETLSVQQTMVMDPDRNRLRNRIFRLRRNLDANSTADVQAATTSMDSGVLGMWDRLIERLLREGLMQVETPAWEMNHWSPTVVRQMIHHDSDLIGTRCRIMLHFFPHYISWQEPDQTPTDFWNDLYGRVDGVLYQADPYWTAGMMAARTQDCLDRLAPGGLWGLQDSGRGHPIDLTDWETIATCQYNNDKDGDGRIADEDIGNLKGYECTCSPGRMTVKGFGGGGRKPEGPPL